MPRPSLSDDKKRKSVSISLRQDILELAEATDNKSRFFERSVEACVGIRDLLDALKSGNAKRAEVFEEIEDIVDAWSSLGEESLPLRRRSRGG